MSGVSRRGLIGAVAGTAVGVAAPGVARAARSRPRLSLGEGQPRLRPALVSDRDWADYLRVHDLTWRRLPALFDEGAFLGNGGLAAAIYQQPDRRAVRIEVGDSRVRDHQAASNALFGRAGLRIGYFSLETAGEVTAVDLRLSLWNGELAGTVTTRSGALQLRCFVHATRDLLVVETRSEGGERAARWSFTAHPARSTRLATHPRPAGLATNPEPVLAHGPGGGSCVQSLAAGGGHATVWQAKGQASTVRLIASVAASYPARTAVRTARHTVLPAMSEPLGDLVAGHRDWWHRFYPRSLVSVPDRRLSSFYWIQLYRLASATRRDRPVVSSTGPWLEPTPTPATDWTLGVQSAYWLTNATGHPELDSLSRSLSTFRDNLVLNAPERYRADSSALGHYSQEDLRSAVVAAVRSAPEPAAVGNLTCAVHNAWLAYRHSMDETVLREVVFPLLRRAVNLYLRLLTEGGDGRLHLPATYPPGVADAPGETGTRDCNYDLALLSWGCRTLLESSDRLGVRDPLRPRWRDVVARLAEPPRDHRGLSVGAGRGVGAAHHGLAHLAWFHPLRVLDPTAPQQRAVLFRSLRYWSSRSGRHDGAALPAAASLFALLGEGDGAVRQLSRLCERHLSANTSYLADGPQLHVPLAAAQSVHDMLLQSWGGVLRVFPAVPAMWLDVTVHDLRAEGGFLVSAVRRGGLTQFVRVRSTAGEPCRVAPGLPGPYAVRWLAGMPGPSRDLGGGLVELDLAAGDEVVLMTAGTNPELTIAPVQADSGADADGGWGLPGPG